MAHERLCVSLYDCIFQILSLKKQGHYQIACMSFFKATHSGKELQGGLQHPNQYFAESQAILNGDDLDAADQNSKKIWE